MNKNTLLNLLLISAICLLVNALASWALFNLGGLASAILSLVFVLNSKKVFGPEGQNAYNSALWSTIVNGAAFILSNLGLFLSVVLAVFTFGISAILSAVLSGVIMFMVDLGFGIWQLVAWNKLKNDMQAPAVAA